MGLKVIYLKITYFYALKIQTGLKKKKYISVGMSNF